MDHQHEKKTYAVLLGNLLYMQPSLNAQVKNCFLEDLKSKKVVIPASVDLPIPLENVNMLVGLKNDTIKNNMVLQRKLKIPVWRNSTQGELIISELGNVKMTAKAKIEGNEVVVYFDNFPIPMAVSFASASNPDCNLINTVELPDIPFRSTTGRGGT